MEINFKKWFTEEATNKMQTDMQFQAVKQNAIARAAEAIKKKKNPIRAAQDSAIQAAQSGQIDPAQLGKLMPKDPDAEEEQ